MQANLYTVDMCVTIESFIKRLDLAYHISHSLYAHHISIILIKSNLFHELKIN